MLSLFSFRALEKLDLDILDFWFYTELSILEWFFSVFQIFINSRTYVFSNSDCSLIDFMGSQSGLECNKKVRKSNRQSIVPKIRRFAKTTYSFRGKWPSKKVSFLVIASVMSWHDQQACHSHFVFPAQSNAPYQPRRWGISREPSLWFICTSFPEPWPPAPSARPPSRISPKQFPTMPITKTPNHNVSVDAI